MITEDGFMMFLVFGGLVLWGAYLRGQYTDWRSQKTADAQAKVRFRLLYPLRSPSRQDRPVPAVDLASCGLTGSTAYPTQTRELADCCALASRSSIHPLTSMKTGELS